MDRLHAIQVSIGREPVFLKSDADGEKPARRAGGTAHARETAPGLALPQDLQAFLDALGDGRQRATLPAGPGGATGPARRTRANRTGSKVIPTMRDAARVTDLAMSRAETPPTLAADSLVSGTHEPAIEVATVRAGRADQDGADVAGGQQAIAHGLPAGLAGPGTAHAQPGLADGADPPTACGAVRAVALAAGLSVCKARAMLSATTGRIGAGRTERTSAGSTRQMETGRALPPTAGTTDLAVGAAVGAMLGTVIPTVCREVAEGAEGKGLP